MNKFIFNLNFYSRLFPVLTDIRVRKYCNIVTNEENVLTLRKKDIIYNIQAFASPEISKCVIIINYLIHINEEILRKNNIIILLLLLVRIYKKQITLEGQLNSKMVERLKE